MTMLFKDDSIEIHHRRKRNYYELSISYKQFKNQLNDLYKTNVFFSTYGNVNSIDGFLPLTDQFYLRVSVIHRLGAIGEIDEDITHEDLVKLEVLPK